VRGQELGAALLTCMADVSVADTRGVAVSVEKASVEIVVVLTALAIGDETTGAVVGALSPGTRQDVIVNRQMKMNKSRVSSRLIPILDP
jgi:hypothetical protein